MTIIKGTTAKGRNLIRTAEHFDGGTLREVYGSYSKAKEQAYHDCYAMFLAEDGYNFHICSHNTFGFSVAWLTEKGYRIETPKSSYLITI